MKVKYFSTKFFENGIQVSKFVFSSSKKELFTICFFMFSTRFVDILKATSNYIFLETCNCFKRHTGLCSGC